MRAKLSTAAAATAAAFVLASCSSGDTGAGDGQAAPLQPSEERCADLETEYLDVFFALGAGIPNNPDATTVHLPVARLDAILRQAGRAGCGDFFRVACSAFAELGEQGLTPEEGEPPANC